LTLTLTLLSPQHLNERAEYKGHKFYEPAYQLAQKYDVPVIFHTGDTYSVKAKLKYADPLTIDEVAVDHADQEAGH
jgi:predicted TIM-barrel fold metal-dependent hydrolase